MATKRSHLEGRRILAVDDEADILETIEDILDMPAWIRARDYDSASAKIKITPLRLALLDIMGVNGLKLLEEAVAQGIPAVMLTAHAINPETLMASIRKGAIAYLPKETLAELDTLLDDLLAAQRGDATLGNCSLTGWENTLTNVSDRDGSTVTRPSGLISAEPGSWAGNPGASDARQPRAGQRGRVSGAGAAATGLPWAPAQRPSRSTSVLTTWRMRMGRLGGLGVRVLLIKNPLSHPLASLAASASA